MASRLLTLPCRADGRHAEYTADELNDRIFRDGLRALDKDQSLMAVHINSAVSFFLGLLIGLLQGRADSLDEHTLKIRLIHSFQRDFSSAHNENILFVHVIPFLYAFPRLLKTSESAESLHGGFYSVCDDIHVFRPVVPAEAEPHRALDFLRSSAHGLQNVALSLMIG